MADDLASQLRKVGQGCGVKVKRPDYLSFKPKDHRKSIGKVIRQYVKEQRRVPKCVLIVLDNQFDNLYNKG